MLCMWLQKVIGSRRDSGRVGLEKDSAVCLQGCSTAGQGFVENPAGFIGVVGLNIWTTRQCSRYIGLFCLLLVAAVQLS